MKGQHHHGVDALHDLHYAYTLEKLGWEILSYIRICIFTDLHLSMCAGCSFSRVSTHGAISDWRYKMWRSRGIVDDANDIGS